MTKVEISKAAATVRDREVFTSGMVGAKICLSFDEAWDGLEKTAVFSCGGKLTDVPESEWEDGVCTVPHECLTQHGVALTVGVYGVNSDGSEAIPTVYATLGYVHRGAEACGEVGAAPTLPIWMRLQEQIGDVRELDSAAEDLVTAINEALTKEAAVDLQMDVAGGSIRYSTDGVTYTPIVALSTLKGDKGDKGDTGESGAASLCIISATVCENGALVFENLPTGKNAYEYAYEAYAEDRCVLLNVTNGAGDWNTLLRMSRLDENGIDFSNYEKTSSGDEPRLQYVKIESKGTGAYSYITPLTAALPTVTAADNGKVLKVVNGTWVAANA